MSAVQIRKIYDFPNSRASPYQKMIYQIRLQAADLPNHLLALLMAFVQIISFVIGENKYDF